MVRKKGTRRKFNLRKVRITPEKSLSTLLSDTAIVGDLTGVSANEYRCKSISACWALTGLTPGEGPITVGYAHSDYSVAEIKECLEAQAAIDFGDKIAMEQGNRLVRVIGSFSPEANSALNDGKPIKTKLNWLIGIGDQVNMFCFNDSPSTLTTGSRVHAVGEMWVQDS